MSGADVSEPYFRWRDPDSDVREGRLGFHGDATLAEIAEALRTANPGFDPMTAVIRSATVLFERPATSEELADRERWNRAREERRERGEREALRNLYAKYGPEALT